MKNTLIIILSNFFVFFSFSSQLIFVILISLSMMAPININIMDQRTLDTYPNYIWIYFQNHYCPQIIFALTVLIFYAGNKRPLYFVKRQLRDLKNRYFTWSQKLHAFLSLQGCVYMSFQHNWFKITNDIHDSRTCSTKKQECLILERLFSLV